MKKTRSGTPHDAEYFRKRRAAKRREMIRAGLVDAATAVPLGDDRGIPAAVFERGRELAEMMRTPLCMWPAEWLDDHQ